MENIYYCEMVTIFRPPQIRNFGPPANLHPSSKTTAAAANYEAATNLPRWIDRKGAPICESVFSFINIGLRTTISFQSTPNQEEHGTAQGQKEKERLSSSNLFPLPRSK